jgi:hypothetical protein
MKPKKYMGSSDRERAVAMLEALYEIVNSKKDKKGVRLQRKKFLVYHIGWPYTITIERGDRLNDRNVD